ncbi:TrmH family RNA methyltransferase [Escherichia coli]
MGFAWHDKRLRAARGWTITSLPPLRVIMTFARSSSSKIPERLFALTTKGTPAHSAVNYQDGDYLMFGPETRPASEYFFRAWPAEQKIRIPMVPDSRSMNLSNAVSVVVYEAWRQLGYPAALLKISYCMPDR